MYVYMQTEVESRWFIRKLGLTSRSLKHRGVKKPCDDTVYIFEKMHYIDLKFIIKICTCFYDSFSLKVCPNNFFFKCVVTVSYMTPRCLRHQGVYLLFCLFTANLGLCNFNLFVQYSQSDLPPLRPLCGKALRGPSREAEIRTRDGRI